MLKVGKNGKINLRNCNRFYLVCRNVVCRKDYIVHVIFKLDVDGHM